MPILGRECELFPDDVVEMPTASAPWEIAHLRSRHEKAVARQLLAARSPFYLPQMVRETRRSGRLLVSRLPLFPGYLFLRRVEGLRQALWRTGALVKVIEVVDQGRLTAELRQIRNLQASNATLRPCTEVVCGDAVRIKEGAFRGYSGIVREERGSLRLIVSVSLIGRSVAVEFPRERLVRLSAPEDRQIEPAATVFAKSEMKKKSPRSDPGGDETSGLSVQLDARSRPAGDGIGNVSRESTAPS